MEEEKKIYKKMIVDMINNIERIDILIYLNRFISNIISKAGK